MARKKKQIEILSSYSPDRACMALLKTGALWRVSYELIDHIDEEHCYINKVDIDEFSYDVDDYFVTPNRLTPPTELEICSEIERCSTCYDDNFTIIDVMDIEWVRDASREDTIPLEVPKGKDSKHYYVYIINK